jgi:hypothetical protein
MRLGSAQNRRTDFLENLLRHSAATGSIMKRLIDVL